MLFDSLKPLNFITGIKISLASPLVILKWSIRKTNTSLYLGCLSEPYTVNAMTGLPVVNGLFCEKIFGPILS